MIKKMIGIVFAAVIVATAVLPVAHAAPTATAAISVSPTTVTVGANVTVVVKLSVSGGAIGAADAEIEYDDSLLDYSSSQSGDFDSNGTGGKVRMSYFARDGVGKQTLSQTLTFKSKKTGSGTVKVKITSMADGNASTLTPPSDKSASVNVQNPQKSSNNNLSKVDIGVADSSNKPLKYKLAPSFSPSVVTYTLTVPHNTDTVTINGTAADSKAKSNTTGDYKITGEKGQKKVTVTAENGAVKVYTFNIVKEKNSSSQGGGQTSSSGSTSSSSASSNTSSEPAPADDLTVTVDGKEMKVLADVTGIKAPSGFNATISTFNGVEIPAFESSDGKMILVALSDGKDSALYIYRRETIEFSLPVNYKYGDNEYLLDSVLYYIKQPSGSSTSEIEIGGVKLSSFIFGEYGEFALVWGVRLGEGSGLYVYDTTEKTLQRYYGDTVGASSGNNGNDGVDRADVDPLASKRTVGLATFAATVAALTAAVLAAVVAIIAQAGKIKTLKEVGNASPYTVEHFSGDSVLKDDSALKNTDMTEAEDKNDLNADNKDDGAGDQ